MTEPTSIGKSTRNKKIDFSKLGQKMTLSNSTCHKCKTMIPTNEENICIGPIEIVQVPKKQAGSASGNGKEISTQSTKKKFEPCSKRFCNKCLQKEYRESWLQKQKSPDTWVCPVCLGNCNCSQCSRKRTKESQLKSQFLAQFDQQNEAKPNKRQDKQITKQQQKLLAKQQNSDQKKGVSAAGVHGHHQTKKQIVQSQPYVASEVKNAISEDDWKQYINAKKKFYECLNASDWSHLPRIQEIKVKYNKQQREKLEECKDDGHAFD